MHDISDIRRDYSQQSLLENEVDPNPINQFTKWWQEVLHAKIDEANAMTLATASSNGMPSARIVLLKDFNHEGFVFFTNYNSFKGQQIAENPKACLVFFWKELERQVRITGLVKKINTEESDAYFNSRPEASRLGALASPQSQVIKDRNWLDDHFKKLLNQFQNAVIQRPENWGGYIVNPVIIEFWQGRPSRLHDRLQYTLVENGDWKLERLAP